MILKLVLVVFLLTGQNKIVFQHSIKFESEQACLKEAAKLSQDSGWYPIQKAACVADLSSLKGELK